MSYYGSPKKRGRHQILLPQQPVRDVPRSLEGLRCSRAPSSPLEKQLPEAWGGAATGPGGPDREVTELLTAYLLHVIESADERAAGVDHRQADGRELPHPRKSQLATPPSPAHVNHKQVDIEPQASSNIHQLSQRAERVIPQGRATPRRSPCLSRSTVWTNYHVFLFWA